MEQFTVPARKGLAPAQTREHSSTVWENHRDRITQLYSVQNKSLEEVMNVMEIKYGFIATPRQYKIRISQWHLDKNIKGSEYEFMAQTRVKRALEDKETNFRVRGRDVDHEKIDRTVKRKKMTEEELLAMPTAPTPSDISYSTPSVVDPQSPYVQQMVAQSPDPAFAASTNQIPVQPIWNASEWQNQAFFQVSPGYLPATPLPVVWHGPTTPLPSTSFQTPPGMLQSPESSWDTAPMDGMIKDGDLAICTDDSDICEPKYDRLIELVRKTEETNITDYMETMTEVNSLVYDLITSDQSRSLVIVKERPATIPECYVCKALKVIGNEDMTAKVESERILLEAIAVSEGCFGEEHRGAFHFRVKLFLLYENWSCRGDSTCSLLIRIMLLASRKAPSLEAPELLSDLLDLPDAAEPTQCAWLQSSFWGSFFRPASYQLSTLSIQDDAIGDLPHNAWGLISAIVDRIGVLTDESRLGFEPILELILHQGPESPDGSSCFWMATFIAVLCGMWGAVCNSKMVIGNIASEILPGSDAIKLSLEKILQNPYRLAPSASTVINGEHGSKTGHRSLAPKHESRFQDISKLKGPLDNLEELRLALAELSLLELEKSDKDHAFATFLELISAIEMHGLLCSAAQAGNPVLIKKLAGRFQNETFDGDISFIDLLNHDGSVADWSPEESPLHLAIETGYLPAVEALLDAGADPEGADPDRPEMWDQNPLRIADENGRDDIVRLLIKRGARPDSWFLKTVFSASDQELHEKCLDALCSDGDIVSLLYGLAMVGEYERYAVLDIVSERIGKELESKRKKTLTSRVPFLYFYEREELYGLLDYGDDSGRGLELILDALTGIPIEQQARGILKTAILGSTDAIDEALDPIESLEFPPLHTLVSRNAPNALGVFLELTPRLTVVDNQGNTALHVAALRNRAACAKHLLRVKIDVDAKNNDGETALQIALRKGHKETSDEILMVLPMSLIVGGAEREG